MAKGSVGYVQLIRENHDFTRLWLGQLVSNLGDWFNSIAVLALVYDLTRSGLATGLVIIASMLPVFILTPFAGVIVDRFDRRKIMMTADVTRGVLALGMLLVRSADQIWLLYIFTALLISFATFFGPALSAAIPNLVSEDELISANGLSSSTWGLMLAIGAAMGGIVIALVGRDAAFVVNSASFFFSATMILLVRKSFGRARATHAQAPGLGTAWSDFTDSLHFARLHPQVMAGLLVKVGLGLAGGIILLLTVYAQGVFRVGDGGIGWLYSARGLGALIGPYLAMPFVGRDVGKMRRVILVSFFVSGAGYLAFSGSPLFVAAALAVVVAHIGNGILWTLSSTMLQLLTPDHMRGRIFALDFGMNTIAASLSTFLVGLALEQWDARWVAATLGFVFLVYAFLWSGMVLWSRSRHASAWLNAVPAPREREVG